MTAPAVTRCEPGIVDASARPELRFYRDALERLNAAHAPYLVGGAYAYAVYTGVQRHTKDCDLFVRARDCRRVLDVLAGAGYRTEVTFPHWLGKAFSGDHLIDVIFSSGNGLCAVDDAWFTHAPAAEILGVPVRLTPPEEMIWSKAFIMERERYDGADIAHVLRACGARIDWDRLVDRFGEHWPVLLSHLVLFAFAYPDADAAVPRGVVEALLARMAAPSGVAHGDPPSASVPGRSCAAAASAPLCRGTFLSRQYLHDVRQWGYQDARLAPWGPMTADEVARWIAAFERE